MSKHVPADKVNPFAERGVTEQLNAWTAALEMAVSTLNRTLTEFKEFQEKGGADVGPEAAGGADCGEHGSELGDG